MSQQETSDLEAYLAAWRARVEDRLGAYLEGGIGPAGLVEAMRYSLLGPGKRLRPLVVLLSCRSCGGEAEAALGAACALEMVHAYSLVHDDLPAMDDDDLRRGRPTCHRKFDEATAILAGDALLTLAFEVLPESLPDAELAAWCVRELARAAGCRGMVGGQFDDLYWHRHRPRSLETLEGIHRHKTGALFRAAVRIGSMIGLAHSQRLPPPWNPQSEPQPMRTLDRFADLLGLAFQISDDLLDVESTADKTGKRVGKDAAQGKLTYPGLLGVSASRDRLQKVCAEAISCLDQIGPAADLLVQLVLRIRDRDC